MVTSMRQHSFSTQHGHPPAKHLNTLVTLIISCVFVRVCVCLCVRVYICMFVCVFAYVFVCAFKNDNINALIASLTHKVDHPPISLLFDKTDAQCLLELLSGSLPAAFL